MKINAYVINLDKRTDRWERTKQHLSIPSLNVERVSAIEGKEIEVSNSWPLSAPEYATWMSHQKALQEFIASDQDFCLVFEDDAVIAHHHKDSVSEVISEVLEWMKRENAAIVQIGHISLLYRFFSRQGIGYRIAQGILGSKSSPISNKFRLHKGQFRAGAHAYMISREAASVLAKANLNPILASDDFLSALALFNIGRQERVLQIASLVPPLFEQDSRGNGKFLDSDISI